MILMDKREETIANIQAAVRKGTYNVKVEPDDPKLSQEQRQALRDKYLSLRPVEGKPTHKYSVNRRRARRIVNLATSMANRETPVLGLEKTRGLERAIVTSNHFSPIDNTVVRKMVRQTGRKYMPVVANEENLAMDGLFGFLMTYADTIPLAMSPEYVTHCFEPMLQQELEKGNFVLIYPEQEMWFNYRKPRPCKRGAYLYAARYDVPVLSCFVELHDKEELQQPDFVDVSYVIHVLDPIYPDPALTPRENSFVMAEKDYQQKVAAYEAAYGKKLNYRFEVEDIAGWVPTDKVRAQVEAMWASEADELCVA